MPNHKRRAGDAAPSNTFVQHEPHKDRVARVRAYLLSGAVSNCNPTALLTMAITGRGDVHIGAVGIEPAHALAMLAQLDGIRERLEAFAAANQPGHGADIIPLRTRARP